MVVSGMLIYLLPLVAGPESVWLAMPVTEAVVAAAVILLMTRYTRELGKCDVM